MKRLILMLFVTLGVALTSQAQSVESVQDNVVVSQSLQDFDFSTQNEVFANLTPPTVKVVSYIYEATPELNETVVTTSDSLYAEVLLENEYGLIKSIAVNDGKFTFKYSNKVLENQIQTKLISANVGKSSNGNLNISTHIVRYLS